MSHEIHVGSSLPPGWDAFSLGSKASFVTSGSRGWARFYSESGDLFLRSQNIRSGHLDLEDRQHVLPPAGAEGKRTRVQPNDLLVTITGNSVGNVAISSDELGISYISQHVGMIRLVNPSLAPYACWYLSPGAPGNKQIMDAQTGQSKPGLNLQNLKDLVVAAPKDKRERDFIVAALDDIQAQADEMQMLLSKKRMLKQAAMQELLTGKRRLPGFVGEWEVRKLGDVANFFKGKGVPKSALIPDGTYPCIHYGELFTHYPEIIVDIISRTNWSRGSLCSIANDVLMPTSDVTPRGLAKASCVTVDGVILGGDILVIRSDRKRVSGSFLSYIIRREEDQVLRLVTGSTVYHLYGSDMKKFTFLMPSLPEQSAIAAVLSEMDAELAVLEQRLTKTCALKQGMSQELLTGKTRLI